VSGSTWQPASPGGPSGPRPLSEALERLAARFGVGSPRLLRSIFGRWEAVVGPAVAAHAWPISLRRCVLLVGVDQPSWATELRYLSSGLLERLTAEVGAGAIERIEIKVTSRRR
jgi:predicted nucleic acid-binding Zn ribbon protein